MFVSKLIISDSKVNGLIEELFSVSREKNHTHLALTSVTIGASCGMYLTELKFKI